MIHGELKNIKKSVLESLEGLYELTVPAGQLVTREIAELMLAVTVELQREVAVYINRQGKVLQVSVGDDATVDLPEIRQRKSENRLSGVRCVHTHPSSDTRLSAPDLSSLRSMRFDVMAAIGIKEGKIYGSMAFLSGELTESGGYVVHGTRELPLGDLNRYNLMQLVTAINKELGRSQLKETEQRQERAILAGVDYNASPGGWSIEDSLAELKGLAETAGAQVAGQVIQHKAKPDNAFFLGRGKVDEIGMLAQNVEADLLIVDDEISPSQQRNLEMSTGLRVVDRTALILDIFAQRARSAAGKLQVELAQLRYNLPRLGGQGLVLSRQGGGIGTRGPGETKLEMDRRRIHGRIHDLEERIAKLKKQRQLHRTQRKNARIPTAALVGYTNAGKSTLLNGLAAGEEVLAEDKLFATLDPTTRLVALDDKQDLLLTDTVGFIQKLPHTLVSAFQATLEETVEADLLLHVVDASDANYELQIKAVMEVLREIGAQDKPSVFVFNKADKLPEAERDNEYIAARMLQGRDGVVISAKDKQGLKMLREKIKGFFNQGQVTLTLCIPYDQGALVTDVYNVGKVEAIDYDEQGTILTVTMSVHDAEIFQKYVR